MCAWMGKWCICFPITLCDVCSGVYSMLRFKNGNKDTTFLIEKKMVVELGNTTQVLFPWLANLSVL